mmetsp:Transcript_19153/g.53346  ORF Transcript_19153/g.53346 Transcript_19153/m.53346 type:complete len:307 (+) Transcript_19153:143-1063(+)
MSNDPELLKKLIEDDELDDIELQKKSPVIVTGVAIDNSSASKKTSRAFTGRRSYPCWCKCVAIIATIFGIFSISIIGCAYVWLKDAVEHLTIETDSPQKFPILKMSEQELDAVKDRVVSFTDALSEGSTNNLDNLVVTQDEINGFIGHSDYLQGNMMITLHENRFEEEYSLPMDILGFDGRYYVGNEYVALDGATADKKKNTIEMKTETAATHEDWFDGPLFFAQLQYLVTKNKDDEGQGVLELFLEKGSFFGQEIIGDHENLLEGLYDVDVDDDAVEYALEVINGIESVSIEEGLITVKPRRFEK